MKILITGPECTGKSTLSAQLHQHTDLPYLPEYAREYMAEVGPDYTSADVMEIARRHHEKLRAHPEAQPLILDTYLLNLMIWLRLKFDEHNVWLEERLAESTIDLVLLMYPDLPWIQDGLRENEGRAEEIFLIFKKEIEALGWPYEIIRGIGEARLQSAKEAVQRLLARKLPFPKGPGE